MPDVRLERGDEGWITVECAAPPGCISQGRTQEEALRNQREAIAAWTLAEAQRAGMSRP